MNDRSTGTEPSSVWGPPETTLGPRSTGSSASVAFATGWALDQTAGTAGSTPGGPVFVVVGFDGSEPAQRALDAAARLLRDRDGRLEVVYVAHVPAGPTPSAGSMAEARWHFERRSGAVARELIAVADELRRQRGADANIVLFVGGSSPKHPHVAGSVSLHLAQVDRFPLVVVP